METKPKCLGKAIPCSICHKLQFSNKLNEHEINCSKSKETPQAYLSYNEPRPQIQFERNQSQQISHQQPRSRMVIEAAIENGRIQRMQSQRLDVFMCEYCCKNYPFDVVDSHTQNCEAKKMLERIIGEEQTQETNEMDEIDHQMQLFQSQIAQRNPQSLQLGQEVVINLQQKHALSRLIEHQPDFLRDHLLQVIQGYQKQKRTTPKQVMDGLTKMKFLQQHLQLSDDNKKCLVCHDEFEVGNDLILLDCLHRYHEECIFKWLKGHVECPVCRYDVTSQPQPIKQA